MKTAPETTPETALDPVDVAIGARIRARREGLRITQAQLAVAAGVTFQQVQKYERGVNRTASARLLRIAAALRTTGAQLLGELDGPAGADLSLAHPGVARLLAAFHRIPDGPARDALLTVAEGLAGADPAFFDDIARPAAVVSQAAH